MLNYSVAELRVYIPKEYEQLELIKEGSTYEDNVYKCKKKGKWGLVNSTNSTLLSCEYNNLTNTGNNIWRTSKSGKYGYVQLNTTSNVTTLIPCIYESLGDYSSDSYIHATLKGKKGIIDCKNNIIIPFEYSTISDPCHTSNGSIIWVEKDGKQFFVTVTDEFVETRQFAKRANGKKIEIGNWKFTKCEYEDK